MEASELLVGNDGENDCGEQKELGEGENLQRSGSAGERFEGNLQFQEQ